MGGLGLSSAGEGFARETSVTLEVAKRYTRAPGSVQRNSRDGQALIGLPHSSLLVLACLAVSDTGVERGGDDGFGVVDLAGVDEAEEFGKGDEEEVDAFVLVGAGVAGSESFGEEDLHPLSKKAG